MWLWRLNWPSHVLLHVLLVLFVPSTLLGGVYPVVVKMALDQGLAAGRTIGSIYAWGMIGGVAGALGAGFFLIPAFGNLALVWFLGTALLLMAVLYWISCWVMYLWGMVFIALATMGMANEPWAQDAGVKALLRERPDPNLVYEAETPYGEVAVRRMAQRPDLRAFVQDGFTRSEMAIGDAAHLSDFHLKVYAGLTHGVAGDKKSLSMLVLGAGGYAFPRHLQAAWPSSRLTVVEVDPGVTTDRCGRIWTRCGDDHPDHPRGPQELRGPAPERAAAGPSGPRYDFIYENALPDLRRAGAVADEGIQ